jgi:hypothetical protein
MAQYNHNTEFYFSKKHNINLFKIFRRGDGVQKLHFTYVYLSCNQRYIDCIYVYTFCMLYTYWLIVW